MTLYVFAGVSICTFTHKIYKETFQTVFVFWCFVVESLPFMIIAVMTSDMLTLSYTQKLWAEERISENKMLREEKLKRSE